MNSKNKNLGVLGRGFRAVLISLLALSFLATSPTRAAGEPDLYITMTHAGGNFAPLEIGRTYTINVENVGESPTTGTVTVVDTLPAGLTATGIDGTGWSCTLGTLTCTRSDALTNGESYPDITLTVNVLVGVLPLITNQAVVSGGGEVDLTNNTALDETDVDAKPDLIITNVTTSPISPDPNEGFDINVTIKNQGGLESESLVYRHVFVNTGNPYNLPPEPETGCPSTDDPYENYFRSDFNDGISPGSSDTKSVSIPNGVPEGSHQLWIFVDATCINDESIETNNAYGPITVVNTEGVPLQSPWVGGVTVNSDQNIVTVGRPHVDSQIMTYNGFAGGSTTMYVPMLFKNMWTGYDAALYIQNLDLDNTANITIKYFDTSGNLVCTKNDTINARSSMGYWMPAENCLPASWFGAAVISSDRNIVAVGRPHIEGQVTSYNGFASGSTKMYVPMLFKDAFGGDYDSALYVQNVTTNTANITLKYYDNTGALLCTKTDTITQLSSKGYWLPTESCLPATWVGGVVVSSDQNIVAVGRPHIGAEITTYSGFTVGGQTMNVPMLFKNGFGSDYNSALYVQNIDESNPVNVTISYYDSTGQLVCQKNDTIAALASKGYWVPSENCLPSEWAGSAVVTANRNIIAVGRPHLGAEIMTYTGFTGGNLLNYIPMLFNNAFGTYNSAFYLQNVSNNPATVTIKFFDTSGNLTCMRQDLIQGFASVGYWVPNVTCGKGVYYPD